MKLQNLADLFNQIYRTAMFYKDYKLAARANKLRQDTVALQILETIDVKSTRVN